MDIFFLKLSAYFNTKLYERHSLIILDEVQLSIWQQMDDMII